MCGIAGIFNLSDTPVFDEELRKMCAVLKHRGPDGEGFYVNKNVGLGHRRLSIIDIAFGHQPMSNEDETIWITYNGEIYNYQDLRSELIKCGHKFNTLSDTEVIVHAYEEWGKECVHKLNGMFAFAIYDGKNLFLARDRLGVKPLYYTIQNGKFIFASEIKAILQPGCIKASLNYEALAEYFTFQNTFGDKTWFKDIKILQPGHYLVCTQSRVQCECYWKLQYKEGLSRIKNEKEYASELRSHFEQAVKRQLMSEVPLGTYLSGGMDTGSISTIASSYIKPLNTFTCGFDTCGVADDEVIFDEREAAWSLANYLGTKHHELVLHQGNMEEVFPRLIWYLEEPRCGISYQVYYINQLINKHVTVALSGCGGDEFFGGYPWRYETILNCKGEAEFEKKYFPFWIRLLSDEEKYSLFLPRFSSELNEFSSLESFRNVMKSCNSSHPLNRAMFFDAYTFLHGLLIIDDKLSMAHSVETRVPFLDNELIDYVVTIPPNLKLNNGNIKYILKLAMNGLLPENILRRPKVGFTPPEKSWYKGKTLKYIESLLFSKKTLDRGYFSPKYVRKIIDDHVSGLRNNRLLIWSLMCFEWWNRIFIDREEIDTALRGLSGNTIEV